MNKSILTILALAVVALFVAGCQQQPAGNNTDNGTNEPVACTMDAKLCPDGSAVGREGPNCEFAACPTAGLEVPEGAFIADFKIVGESAEQCATIRFSCEEGYEYYATESACGCIQFGYDTEFKGEDIACTREYMPVCAWFNQSTQCIAYPCAVTVGNKCEAQTVENVAYYTQGECPLPSEGVPKVDEDTLLTYTYQPKQCQTTPWEEWLAVATFEAGNVPEGTELIAAYYESKGIEVEDAQRVESDMMVCEACDICPTTHSFTLRARAGDKLALTGEGWTSSESVTQGENRRYMSDDPNECAAMTFLCEEGEQQFFDETGCGCEQA